MYVDRMNLRRIGRHLGTHHRTVSLWVKAHADSLPAAPLPEEMKEAEMDELFTFIGDKKQDLHPHARRPTHTLLSGLESGLGAHQAGYSSDGGRCAQGEMLLQRCF